MAPKKNEHSWDDYVQEAEIEPFVLRVSADETIEFPAPTGTSLIRIMRGLRTGDLEAILYALAGDHWPRLEEMFSKAGHKAFPKLVEDMMDHFELYEDVVLEGPGGGKVKRRRPTDIQRLIEQGYRPVGEVSSRT